MTEQARIKARPLPALRSPNTRPAPSPLMATPAWRGEHLMTRLGLVTVVVRDYDEAIASYQDVVGFDLLEDTRIEDENSNFGAVPSQSLRSAVL
ncbi:VOC family protein [Streptomyces sp. NPDC057575]|uniref:VOC family protein n=1 Tax=unclassified Streptomyces TaxID=2593676 RepID=UPI003693D622